MIGVREKRRFAKTRKEAGGRDGHVGRSKDLKVPTPANATAPLRQAIVWINNVVQKILPLLDENPLLVRGPITSTDNAVTRFDGTGGDVQVAPAKIDDEGNLELGNQLTNSGLTISQWGPGVSDGLTLTIVAQEDAGLGSGLGGAVHIKGGAGTVTQGKIKLFGSTVGIGGASADFLVVDASGNIAVSGTVDGRDVAADGTKLDGVCSTESELTIASGEITLPSHTTPGIRTVPVDTEADAATDALDTINGGLAGDQVFLHTADDSRDVQLTNAGNLKIGFASPFTLQATTDIAHFVYAGSAWNAVSLSNNG